MQVSRPLSAVSPGPRGAVLTVLIRTDSPLTGRTVASLVTPHASLRTIQLALDDLVGDGLVHRRQAGNAHLYELNRAHMAVPVLEQLAGLRDELVHRIGSHVSAWNCPAEAVWLFGSTVRGDDDRRSDVDLLVLRAESTASSEEDESGWQTQLTDLAALVHGWTGNSCEILELSTEELAQAVARDDRLVRELRTDAVAVYGRSPRSVLRRRPAARG